MPFLLVIAVGLLLILASAFAPRGIPWANALVRVNPGSGKRAEWVAPPAVVRAVKRDFLAAHAGLAECSNNWGMLAGELERYVAGDYLRRQRAALGLLVHARGPRLADAVTADHALTVRRFSADGLRCLVLDWQTNTSVTTSRYWSGEMVHRQRMPDAARVWQMIYDGADRRWKIERLVQTLPAPAISRVPITLAEELPAHAGRDH